MEEKGPVLLAYPAQQLSFLCLPSGSFWEILSDSPPQFHQATHKPKFSQNAFQTGPQTEKKKKSLNSILTKHYNAEENLCSA